MDTGVDVTEEWLDGFKRALAEALNVDPKSDITTLLQAARNAHSVGRAEERALIVTWLRSEGEGSDDEDGDLLLDVADMLEEGMHYGADHA